MQGHVLVWAAGDDARSLPYAQADLDELRRGAEPGRVSVSWVVDLGRAVGEAWRDGGRLRKDPLGDMNMGDPEALGDWIDQSPDLRGGEGVLVISGHGTGWAGEASTPRRRMLGGDRERLDGGPHGMVAWDESHADALDTAELLAVLGERFRDPPLAVLGFDACFMAGLELFAHLGGCARVLVGSGYEAPSGGWGYDTLLAHYADASDAESFAGALVADFGARWASPPVSKVAHLVAVSGPGVIAARAALHALGEAALAEAVRPSTGQIRALRPFGSPAPAFDVLDVAALLAERAGGGTRTAHAAAHLAEAARACIVASISHPQAHPSGLSVYLGNPEYEAVAPQYLALIGPNSGWARFITSLWAP